MSKKDRIVLKGVFQVFERKTRNRPYYTEEEFQEQLEGLRHKELMEDRIKKINKICQKN
jgi:hypothetical protein